MPAVYSHDGFTITIYDRDRHELTQSLHRDQFELTLNNNDVVVAVKKVNPNTIMLITALPCDFHYHAWTHPCRIASNSARIFLSDHHQLDIVQDFHEFRQSVNRIGIFDIGFDASGYIPYGLVPVPDNVNWLCIHHTDVAIADLPTDFDGFKLIRCRVRLNGTRLERVRLIQCRLMGTTEIVPYEIRDGIELDDLVPPRSGKVPEYEWIASIMMSKRVLMSALPGLADTSPDTIEEYLTSLSGADLATVMNV